MIHTSNHIKLHYRQFIGDPSYPTTLILHGWGASGDTMRVVFDELVTQNKSAVLLDLPPFGLSAPPPKDYDIHKYARLTKEFIIQLKLSHINIIAHSFGARISLILASETHSEFTLEKLVLTGAAGLKPKRGLKYRLKVCAYKLKKILGLNTANAGSSDYQALPDYLKGVFVRVVNTHLDKLLPKINVPTLIIFGANDTDTPLYMAKRLHNGVKNSKLHIMQGCGHYAFLDDSITFNALISAFL